ncbi:hypothetical protein DFS34DRAFT_690680 [Phlyctochytrium arcticum]|nr:hypothetical protein DFS34DRAFT_690680 [Phlyctochytrium arcticum]
MAQAVIRPFLGPKLHHDLEGNINQPFGVQQSSISAMIDSSSPIPSLDRGICRSNPALPPIPNRALSKSSTPQPPSDALEIPLHSDLHRDPTPSQLQLDNDHPHGFHILNAHHQHQAGIGADGHNHDPSMPLLVSLRVCRPCQEALLGAFDHCLAKHGATPPDGAAQSKGEDRQMVPTPSSGFTGVLDSVYHIDEAEDGKRLTEPPYFRIVKDPTQPRNRVFTDISDKIERERWAFLQQKKAASGEHPFNSRLLAPPVAAAAFGTNAGLAIADAAAAKGLGIDTNGLFSSALYKRTLAAKDREIQMLREQVYEKTVAERAEAQDVEKLRAALKRAVNYYVYAEEWQQHESSRLQQDVRCLKAELSSLMAFLINAEEEKRKLSVEIQNLHGTIGERDEKLLAKDVVVAETKAKLHESFKEFLQMDELIAKLRKEAERGSDVTQARNQILQKNLDKLARDHEETSKDLVMAQNRMKELEFELEELVLQFNSTGEKKKSAEESVVRLTAELDKTSGELKRTTHAYDISTMQNRQLEGELREMNRIHTDTKYDLEVKLSTLTKEFEGVTEQKKESEATVKQLKIDNEKLNNALKSVTRSKDQLESAFRVSTQKHGKEIEMRDSRITELTQCRAEDAKDLKKLQEQKEQLMFQVTDLQNALDRETANVNMANFEMSQVKRQSEEKTSLLEEQIEKLNLAKNNLANDKRSVTEKYKFTRGELQTRDQELADERSAFATHRAAAATVEEGLRAELSVLNEAHDKLVAQHSELVTAHAVATSSNVDLYTEREVAHRRQSELQAQVATTSAELTSVRETNAQLANDLASVTASRTDIKTHLDSVLIKVAELTANMSGIEREHAAVVKEKDAQITKLAKESYNANEEVARLDKLSKKLQRLVDKLDQSLQEAQKALASETSTREHLELTLHDIRQSLNSERKVRLEFERMHSRLDRRDAERDLERLSLLRTRDRLLADVTKGLHAEYGRLKTISTMLPRDEDLVVIEGPEIKDFKPGDVPGGGAKGGGSMRTSDGRPSVLSRMVRPPATVIEEKEPLLGPSLQAKKSSISGRNSALDNR